MDDFVVNDLVSIIIPAYNVENYIEECISSVLKQTYKKIEIIIVDDGSQDGTGKILDDFAELDNRIKIIHKDNGGVSSARNIGIDSSNGEFLIFVDGDDYLARDCVRYMVELITTTKADFCFSCNAYTKSKESQIKKDKIEVLTPENATALLLSPRVIVGCWNKIYRRKLIFDNEIRFNEQLFYGEGLQFITTVAQKSNSIGIGRRKIYYYRKNNQKSATSKLDLSKMVNGWESIIQIENEISKRNKNVNIMLRLHKCMFSLGAIVCLRGSDCHKKYLEQYKFWLRYLRKNLFNLLGERNISLYRKCLLIGGSISPGMLYYMDKIRRKLIRYHSV